MLNVVSDDENANWLIDYIAEDYIIFAEYDIGWFCMEKSSGKYCELDKPSVQEVQTFDTLEVMLKRVLLLSVEL